MTFDLLGGEPIRATGKTIESLAYSRNKRMDILALFDGVLPQSIMWADRRSRGNADLAYGTYDESEYKGNALQIDLNFGISGKGARSGALSTFPYNIGKSVVVLYSKPGNVIVDPFAGHNSRMELCLRLGRNYIGCDVSERFMEFNRERLTQVLSEVGGVNAELHLCDSRKMEPVKDKAGDFTLTSPPYWDIEYYGDKSGQLGKSKTYEDFLSGLGLCAKSNFRTLKPGAFCVWFVNDFRMDGKFYPYHRDTMSLLEDAGFVIWDMMIVDLGYPIRAAFASQVVEQKILPKRHEYGIICRKP